MRGDVIFAAAVFSFRSEGFKATTFFKYYGWHNFFFCFPLADSGKKMRARAKKKFLKKFCLKKSCGNRVIPWAFYIKSPQGPKNG